MHNKDHGMTGGFHDAVLKNIARSEAILASVPEEHRQKVLDTQFDAMVDELAKPGADMIATLKFTGFLRLLQVCTKVIDKGNELDVIKKEIVYSKDPATLVPACQFLLPGSAELGKAFESLTPESMHMLHMAVGLAGEAAEMLEQVVGHVLGATLDGENVREEGGDAMFYIQGLMNGIETNIDEMMLANKAKLLGKRYAKGYSDKAAQERADKPAGE